VVCPPPHKKDAAHHKPHKKDAAHHKYLMPELSFVLIHISRLSLPPFPFQQACQLLHGTAPPTLDDGNRRIKCPSSPRWLRRPCCFLPRPAWSTRPARGGQKVAARNPCASSVDGSCDNPPRKIPYYRLRPIHFDH
jgi:hypothetical protein